MPKRTIGIKASRSDFGVSVPFLALVICGFLLSQLAETSSATTCIAVPTLTPIYRICKAVSRPKRLYLWGYYL